MQVGTPHNDQVPSTSQRPLKPDVTAPKDIIKKTSSSQRQQVLTANERTGKQKEYAPAKNPLKPKPIVPQPRAQGQKTSPTQKAPEREGKCRASNRSPTRPKRLQEPSANESTGKQKAPAQRSLKPKLTAKSRVQTLKTSSTQTESDLKGHYTLPDEPTSKANKLVTRSVQTSPLKSNTDSKETHAAAKQNKNGNGRIYNLLAKSTLVSSGRRYSSPDLNFRRDAPPSPAPCDPELDNLKELFIGPFYEFVPTVRYRRFTNELSADECDQPQSCIKSSRSKSHPGDWRYDPYPVVKDDLQLLLRLYEPDSSGLSTPETSETDEILSKDVFAYRKKSAKYFLEISPELPAKLKVLISSFPAQQAARQ